MLGFTKLKVLPLPEPPITSTFLFLAVNTGCPFTAFPDKVNFSVLVNSILLSYTGSINGAISFLNFFLLANFS